MPYSAKWTAFLSFCAVLGSGCGGGESPTDAGGGVLDAGGGRVDAGGRSDAGGIDAGLRTDAGVADSGADAANADAGSTDGGSDAGHVADAGGADAGRADAGIDAGRRDAGPITDLTSCTVTSDCTLAIHGCCTPCGQPALGDVDAVNVAAVDAHRTAVCPVPGVCPECASAPNPWLIATCEAGHCRAVDVRASSIAGPCTTVGECRVRTPSCCDCGAGGDNPIGIRIDQETAFEALTCDPGSTCPAGCTPSFPAGTVPWCHGGTCDAAIP